MNYTLTARDFGVRVLFQMCVQNSVADLIAHFIWNIMDTPRSLTVFTTFIVFVVISQPGGKKRDRWRVRVRVSEITHHQLGTTRKCTYLRFAPHPVDGPVQTPTSGTRPVGRRPEVVCYQRTQNGSSVFVSSSIQEGKNLWEKLS